MEKTDLMNQSKTVPGKTSGESVAYLKDKWKSAIYSLIIALTLAGIAVVVDEPLMAGGIGLGLVLGLVNYFLVAAIIDRGIQVQSQGSSIAAFITMVVYHVRFWILALIMYLVFEHWGARFGLSMIMGMSLLKWTALVEILETCFQNKKM